MSHESKRFASVDGVLYNKEKSQLLAFPSGKKDTNITLPSSLTAIGDNAFNGCGVASITIPAQVSSIGRYAFANCKNLTSIDLPQSVNTIGEGAFSQSGLRSVIIPKKVREISDNLLNNCENLSTVTLYQGITKIGAGAFAGSGLTECNSNLTEITIPSTTKDFGPWIEENEYLNIPEGGVLMSCNNLQKIYCKTVTPPEASDRVTICPFEILSSGTLYVPTGTAEAYKAAPGWRYFKTIVEMDFSGIDAVETEQKPKVTVADGRMVVSGDCGLAVEIFAVNGTLMFNGSSGSIPALGHGIYIVRVGNTTEKVIL